MLIWRRYLDRLGNYHIGPDITITVIEIKGGAITVVATGGDHHLGGRNWDEAVVMYLAEQWKAETGSSDEPTDSEESLQDLWGKAEQAKWALTARQETKIVVTHARDLLPDPELTAAYRELSRLHDAAAAAALGSLG